MLSIPGQTFGEVFHALSTRTELDASERSAASNIAAYLVEFERLQTAKIEATESNDRVAWDAASDALLSHIRSNPHWNPLAQSRYGEMARWKIGRILFTVAPYTTGATMNVGVDRV